MEWTHNIVMFSGEPYVNTQPHVAEILQGLLYHDSWQMEVTTIHSEHGPLHFIPLYQRATMPMVSLSIVHKTMPTFCLFSSDLMGSKAEQDFPLKKMSNLPYLLKPQELEKNGSFSFYLMARHLWHWYILSPYVLHMPRWEDTFTWQWEHCSISETPCKHIEIIKMGKCTTLMRFFPAHTYLAYNVSE